MKMNLRKCAAAPTLALLVGPGGALPVNAGESDSGDEVLSPPGDGAIIAPVERGARSSTSAELGAQGHDGLIASDPVLQDKQRRAEAAWAQLQQQRNNAASSGESGPQTMGAAETDTLEATAECVDGDCSWRTVASMYQYPQEKYYYCGPSALKTLVRPKVSISQSTAAGWSYLRTESYTGTPWYDGTYPMQTALNKYLGPYGATYYVAAVSGGGGTSTQKTAYRQRLVSNVQDGWGIAGNTWEVKGGYHLAGHPDREIFHWIAVRGYQDWGYTTSYANPAEDSPYVSWSANVPRYATHNSNELVAIFGGRGYVW